MMMARREATVVALSHILTSRADLPALYLSVCFRRYVAAPPVDTNSCRNSSTTIDCQSTTQTEAKTTIVFSNISNGATYRGRRGYALWYRHRACSARRTGGCLRKPVTTSLLCHAEDFPVPWLDCEAAPQESQSGSVKSSWARMSWYVWLRHQARSNASLRHSDIACSLCKCQQCHIASLITRSTAVAQSVHER
ncbi:hypothetical protein OBBRIDRAFT_658995 [Obba rivulosa]|uniref:Uncharacterized protein n=1 Tax=Obba rivulosa TaxID=1052685 RepID=A0A8E2DL60_9APHY|nr:hypothetical protein OBBRIDRAFT_658995 [Obba rivulosa]